jgi:ankyrin repeat protein
MEFLFDADKRHFSTWLWLYNDDKAHDYLKSMSSARPKKPEAVPLYHAARLGFHDLAERLIVEHPEHVSARGGEHETPTYAAVVAGNVDILALLIEHGADVEGRSRSINGGTPLHRAAWDGRLEVGQSLLDRGANINSRNNSGNTPLSYAVINKHVEFVRMLLERGAVIDGQDIYGNTPLHRAAQGVCTQAVQLLLEHGADVNVRNEWGKTPYELASSSGYQEIVELLSAHGAESVKK